jgi:UDP-N-acetylenolpyruvoylglucosamine reductase
MFSICDYLNSKEIQFEENVSLSKKTWLGTGGVCQYWISPKSIRELVDICQFLYKNGHIFEVVGQTSNIFFHSTSSPQVVISTTGVKEYSIDGEILIANCGVSVVKMAKDMLAQGYAGFYGLTGLPGTVASAIVNNAGCFGCSLSSMLISADVLLSNGSIETWQADNFGYSHRSSILKRKEKDGVVLSVRLKLKKAGNPEEEKKKAESAMNYRRTKQEHSGRNLGSVFASRKMKKNVKNIVTVMVQNIVGAMRLMPKRRAQKHMLLWLYGYKDLAPYVSDRNVNTFVWRDERAESMFIKYKEFIGKVFDDAVLEIEERF